MYSFRSVRFITIPETGSICRGSTRWQHKSAGNICAQVIWATRKISFLCQRVPAPLLWCSQGLDTAWKPSQRFHSLLKADSRWERLPGGVFKHDDKSRETALNCKIHIEEQKKDAGCTHLSTHCDYNWKKEKIRSLWCPGTQNKSAAAAGDTAHSLLTHGVHSGVGLFL